MKNLTNCFLFALLSVLTACEKEIVIQQSPPGDLVVFKSVDWLFAPASSVSDTGYYSVQGYNAPELIQYTRVTEMKVSGQVMMDARSVKFSGDFYVKQVSGNKLNAHGYLNICEVRDDNSDDCLELVLIPKAPILGIKALSDLKLAQTFRFSAQIVTHSGKYDKPENNSNEFELIMIIDPPSSTYT